MNLDCVICGADTPETIDNMPMCLECIELMESGDKSDIAKRVDEFEYKLTIDDIADKTAIYAGISCDDIRKKSRKREIVWARQAAMHICLMIGVGTQEKIGRLIGNKDHATAIHARKTVSNLLETDKEFRGKWGEFIDGFKKFKHGN